MAPNDENSHSGEFNPIIQTEWYFSKPSFRNALATVQTLL